MAGRAFIAMMSAMRGRIRAGARFAIVGGLLLPLASVVPRAHAGPPGSPPAPGTSSAPDRASTGGAAPSPHPAPRAYLIHLIDGSDPIVVKRYVEEGDQIRFEKLGGWIGIPRYEVLKIVPDVPDAAPAGALPPAPSEPTRDESVPGPAGPDRLLLTTRDGASVRAQAVTAEGDRLRVTVPDGSFTLARSDVVGIVKIPPPPGHPEAWLTVFLSEATDGAAGPSTPATPPAAPTATAPGAPVLVRSDQPHLLRLASGEVLHIDGYWVEGNEIRFRRMGGMVGMALSEVARLIPEGLAPVAGRTAVRYGSQLGPDLLEVRGQSGVQRVRLIGIEPVPDVYTSDDPWQTLSPGIVVYLEFDRQRYDRAGDWLAYLFLPNGRMLNASFRKYEVPRFDDVPELDVQLLNRPDLPSAGAGETPIIAIAPAIANAVAHASGVRIRQMPMRLPARA